MRLTSRAPCCPHPCVPPFPAFDLCSSTNLPPSRTRFDHPPFLVRGRTCPLGSSFKALSAKLVPRAPRRGLGTRRAAAVSPPGCELPSAAAAARPRLPSAGRRFKCRFAAGSEEATPLARARGPAPRAAAGGEGTALGAAASSPARERRNPPRRGLPGVKLRRRPKRAPGGEAAAGVGARPRRG